MGSGKGPTFDETSEAPVIDFAAVRRGDVPPEKPTLPVLSDDLAQTMEAPAAPRLQLMDAAEMAIAEHGYPGATPEAIARGASLSVEMLRAIFPDDLTLLRALHERFCSQALRVVVEAAETTVFERAPLATCLDRTVRSLVDVLLGRAALVRAVLVSGDARMMEAERKWLGAVASRVARALDGLPEKPAAKELAFAFFLVVALVHETLFTSPDAGTVSVGAPLALDREGLHVHVAEAVRAYLART